MSSITEVQSITKAAGTKVVPALTDYDDHSPNWSEAEYHARLERSNSLAGYWEGEPGWVRMDVWPYNEICVLFEGSVAIEDSEGERVTYSAGEAFLIPAGFGGIWHTLEPTRKIFVGVLADS